MFIFACTLVTALEARVNVSFLSAKNALIFLYVFPKSSRSKEITSVRDTKDIFMYFFRQAERNETQAPNGGQAWCRAQHGIPLTSATSKKK